MVGIERGAAVGDHVPEQNKATKVMLFLGVALLSWRLQPAYVPLAAILRRAPEMVSQTRWLSLVLVVSVYVGGNALWENIRARKRSGL